MRACVCVSVCVTSTLGTETIYFFYFTLIQPMDHGPRASQSVAWKSQHDDHLPAVSKFQPPEDFLGQLKSQVYGPTTLLIASNVSELS